MTIGKRSLPVCLQCRWRWPLHVLAGTIAATFAHAEVSTDGSLGAKTTLGPTTFAIPAGLGKQSGGNLFHSFDKFNVSKGESAIFQRPLAADAPEVLNVLARVTGGRSTIDGLLSTSEMPGANFFLLNPDGVIFKANAALDVGGSFAVVTGDRITLEDGARFNALPGPDDALLTSAPPAAFGFIRGVAGPITIDGSQLIAAPGSKVSVIGGAIRMKNGAGINASGVVIRGGKLAMTGARIDVNAASSADRVDVRVRGTIALRGAGSINSFASGGGNVVIAANRLSIADPGSGVAAFSFGEGQGANVQISLAGPLEIGAGGVIQTSAGGIGPGGRIAIRATRASLVGGDFLDTGISADTFDAPAGDVRLDLSGALFISAGARISSDTFGGGAGGNVAIAAESVQIAGLGLLAITGISTETQGTLGGGAGGSIALSVRGAVDVTGGGQITATTFGTGDGGSVALSAASLRVAGEGALLTTGISARTQNVSFGGRGGDVRLRIGGHADIIDGGTIAAGTAGPGAGGAVNIEAGSLALEGAASSITATTDGPFGGGAGGNIIIETGQLDARSGARISASTTGSGAGGSIDIITPRLTLDHATISADTSSKDRVSQPRIISDLEVNLTIDQPIDENLIVLLRHPDGTNIPLVAGVGGQGSNFTNTTFAGDATISIADPKLATAPFTGRFLPLGPLEVFDGRPFNGEWTLAIVDEQFDPSNPAVLRDWSLSTGGATVSSGAIAVSLPGPGDSTNNVSMIPVNVPPEGLATIKPGRGGDVRIQADSVLLDHGARLSARTLNASRGGDVQLDVAGALDVHSGGVISAGTAGTGPGGNIQVKAGTIAISPGDTSLRTLIEAESTRRGAGGRGGDIMIQAQHLEIKGAADFSTGISARSLGAGGSGTVQLDLGTLSLRTNAFVGSSNSGSGEAGSVVIHASNGIFLRGGSLITTSARRGDAGVIAVTSGTRLDLHEGSSVTASAGRNGGSISLIAPDFIHLTESSVTATAGTVSLANVEGGAGGNIFVDPEFLVLDHSVISGNAAIGRGGNILLRADNFLSSTTPITATGTTAGTVEIAAPELDLAAGLVILPGALVDASTQLREQCARRLGLDFSSFLVIGRGGVEIAPDEPLPSAASDWRENVRRTRLR